MQKKKKEAQAFSPLYIKMQEGLYHKHKPNKIKMYTIILIILALISMGILAYAIYM
jgi:hypothetical protein